MFQWTVDNERCAKAALLSLSTNKPFFAIHNRIAAQTNIKATPHDPRLTPLHIICLPAFRHITQILLDLRQQACVEFRQSDEKLDGASDAQGSCGVALNQNSVPADLRQRRCFASAVILLFIGVLQDKLIAFIVA